MNVEIAVNLPPQMTPFVGREEDLATVRERLADPSCRLLTLVGPGGIGKTRLGIEAAATERRKFEDGLFFVPLQSATSADELVSAIADALGLPLSGSESREQQLSSYLRHKALLLLLDNFEQLLAPVSGTPEPDAEVEARDTGCATFLSELLRAAPGVRLLVTSREALRLQEEWLYPVGGLSFPSDNGQQDDLASYDAVQLFISRARRVKPDFSLQEDPHAVARICRLVGGMPLALELAATWIRTLTASDIAAEIERNIDFLATDLRNVSTRHRSMVAVFEHSWKLMTAEEQAVFQRLSIFRGGFTRQAAAEVAGASLSLLSALVDKSMLRRSANGRYQIHELLRQFGEVRLRESGPAVRETGDRHCRHYMSFLHERLPQLNDRRQRQAAVDIAAELDNVRGAWQWAVRHGNVQALAWGVSSYFYFCQLQSRYLECAEALADAVTTLRAEAPSHLRDFTLARSLTHLGWMRIRLGQFEAAANALQESRRLHERLEADPLPFMGTDPAVPLAVVALIRGEHERAVALGKEARAAAEARGDDHNLSFAHYALTAARYAQGQYDSAYAHAEKACHLAHAMGNKWFLPYALNEWGNVSRAMGNIAEARRHFQASYELKEAFEDREGMAVALNHLGEIACLQGNYGEAQHIYEQARSLYQDLNDRGGLATSLKGMGQTAAAQGELETARRHFASALNIAAKIQYWPLVFTTFVDVNALLQRRGQASQAIALLSLVYSHASSNQEIKARAATELEQWWAQVPSEQYDRAIERGEGQELATAVATLQTILGTPFEANGEQGQIGDGSQQSLFEPLTERELEVLQLMAHGKTNVEIAEELVIAVGTVKWYASEIYGKLGVANRTEAAIRAKELGLIA